jgi:hypothetical protein
MFVETREAARLSGKTVVADEKRKRAALLKGRGRDENGFMKTSIYTRGLPSHRLAIISWAPHLPVIHISLLPLLT